MPSPILYTLFLFLFCTVLVSAGADYYKILDLHRSASDADIKKAYKRLSRKYHPDRNKEQNAEEKFVGITRAYEVLSDPEKRSIYDRHGEEGLKAREGGGGHANPFDVFSSFFGGGNRDQSVRRGPTMVSEFEVPLADMYTGNPIDFRIKKKILCDHCRGTGAASDSAIKPCGGCGGTGVKIGRQQIFPGMFAQTQQTCNECGGKGKVIVEVCYHCGGAKVMDHTAQYTLDVLPGMPEGYEVVFEGEGDQSAEWEAGDVVLKVRSQKQAGDFRRKETSLYWKEVIGVDEALLGFERNITHLDGHEVHVLRKGVTQPGFVMKVTGEGMPIFEGHGNGDLFIEFNVVLPERISPELRKRLADVFMADGKWIKDEL